MLSLLDFIITIMYDSLTRVDKKKRQIKIALQ